MPVIDLTGNRFGRLVVVSRAENGANWKTRWLCTCDCGETRTVYSDSLRSGKTQSCGCYHKEKASQAMTKTKTTHGASRTRVYTVWQGMKQRCSDKSLRDYHRYGGRGIAVCERWIHSFENFIKDMGNPEAGMTLERENNDLGYSPDNCIWATMSVQANNRRSSRYITHDGLRLTHSQWSRRLGGSGTLVHSRIKCGWSEERAVTTPPMR